VFHPVELGSVSMLFATSLHQFDVYAALESRA
jgi:hypothetical protein